MKRVTIACCIAVFLFACGEEKKADESKKDETTSSSSTSTSNSEAKTEAWVPVDTAAMNKAWAENMAVGPQHEMMAKWNGTWNAETTMWMAPDAPPEKGNGTSVNKMMLGGRYQSTSFKGNFMGMPYEGHGMMGYDNSKKMFTSTWMDNMSTTSMYMEGTWDDATKSINLKGKMLCSANGKEMEMKEVYKVVDDNTHVMEMYGPDMQTGKEFKQMEIKFTRKM